MTLTKLTPEYNLVPRGRACGGGRGKEPSGSAGLCTRGPKAGHTCTVREICAYNSLWSKRTSLVQPRA